MIWLILFYALVLVNETVDTSLHDALLDNCRGRIELSGDSMLSHFNGRVVARDANLTIQDSEIDTLLCYNSTVRAYHNLIRYTQLDNCTFIASLNTLVAVRGNNSKYMNDFVTYTVFNETKTEYIGNFWLFGSFSTKPVDKNRDYVSDIVTCPYNIKIDGSHFCERPLLALHISYKFHGVSRPEVLTQPPETPEKPSQTPEKPPQAEEPRGEGSAFAWIPAIAVLAVSLGLLVYVYRKVRR